MAYDFLQADEKITQDYHFGAVGMLYRPHFTT